MKLFISGDLHWEDRMYEMEQSLTQCMVSNIEHENPDIIVLTGDIIEPRHSRSPYKILASYLPDLPIICVMGNHEFMFHKVQEVYDAYREMYNPRRRDIHFLDICGHKVINGVRFLGNTLWYDGSLQTVPSQDIRKWANGMWSDKHIKDFDPFQLNARCVEQIENNIPDTGETGVLVTHHVPHRDLDGNISSVPSEFDVYSGMDNLFPRLSFTPDYCLCGHTHRTVVSDIHGISCVNVGNDFYRVRYEILEI